MAEHVFILEHHFTSIPFAAVCEALSHVYPEEEVPNKNIPKQHFRTQKVLVYL
jgi:hypothetical protein